MLLLVNITAHALLLLLRFHSYDLKNGKPISANSLENQEYNQRINGSI